MTTVFRSCLPRFYSNTDQSRSNEYCSDNSMDCLSMISNENTTTNPPLNSSKTKSFGQLSTSSKRLSQAKKTKKRGPRYTRIVKRSPPFLTRLVGTIFGDYGSVTKTKQQRSKKSLLPSKSKIEKQFEENEQTLHSLVTLLTQIESNSNQSMENEQARNNNRIDDTSSNDSFHHHHHQSKHSNNKKRQVENDHPSSHYSFRSSRKMIDNQQQTHLYPTKITIGTSTQYHNGITSEPSWCDLMREDPPTINAWARIRRRLKPQEQKDILRALMIICANLFDVPLENKHI